MRRIHKFRKVKIEKIITEITTKEPAEGLHLATDSPEEIQMCLSCPLPECMANNKNKCPLLIKRIADKKNKECK